MMGSPCACWPPARWRCKRLLTREWCMESGALSPVRPRRSFSQARKESRSGLRPQVPRSPGLVSAEVRLHPDCSFGPRDRCSSAARCTNGRIRPASGHPIRNARAAWGSRASQFPVCLPLRRRQPVTLQAQRRSAKNDPPALIRLPVEGPPAFFRQGRDCSRALSGAPERATPGLSRNE